MKNINVLTIIAMFATFGTVASMTGNGISVQQAFADPVKNYCGGLVCAVGENKEFREACENGVYDSDCKTTKGLCEDLSGEECKKQK